MREILPGSLPIKCHTHRITHLLRMMMVPMQFWLQLARRCWLDMVLICCGIPHALSVRHMLSRWMLLKAYSCLCHSEHCSMMLHRVNIWSMHPCSFRISGCSCLSRWSTALDIRLRMRLARILLGTDRRVTPLQLLQLLRAPLFGIFTMTPSVQSSSCCEEWLNNLCCKLWLCLEEYSVEAVLF